MKVEISNHFKENIYPNLSRADRYALFCFIKHVECFGLNNLTGKLKPSWNIPVEDEDYDNKVSFTRTHNIWHYHIGRPEYQTSQHGDYLTSDEVIFIKRFDPRPNKIRIVGWSSHPLKLPTQDEIKGLLSF